MRRQHYVAILAALALFDPDHHALAVDVGHLQRHHLRTENDRQLARMMDECRVRDDVVSSKRDPEKEPQRRSTLIEGRNADAARSEMRLIAANVLERRSIGRMAEEGGELLDPLHVVTLRLRR